MTPSDGREARHPGRLSQLLGAEVVGADGAGYGYVTDVRLGLTGAVPAGPGVLALPVVEALLVSPHHTGALFGYERRSDQGPALVRAVVRRLHRNAVLVRWTDVVDWDADGRRVTLVAGSRPDSPTP